jgi:nitrogen fixation protein NifU and related proteins
MDLDSLYQEIILDHYKNPHHEGLREPFEAEVHHVNPTCGDEVTMRVHLSSAAGSDPVVEDVLEDAVAFAGVAKFPARVKCALLSWMAWKDATSQIVAADRSVETNEEIS